MRIIYTNLLRKKLQKRRIKFSVPRKVFRESTERYWDNEDWNFIAVMKFFTKRGEDEVCIAYNYKGKSVIIVSAYILQKGRKQKHIQSGRWERIDEEEI